MDYRATLARMSLAEKADLISGTDFWLTDDLKTYGIGALRMSDGPCGIRKAISSDPLASSLPATCFPALCSLGNTFNCDLAHKMGEALGQECQENHINILLGPGINIKRNPLGGRNFEYLSEDPCLTGAMASEYIKGVQDQGVGCCLKHYCCNNQEDYRFTSSSAVDERALREIYLAGFEMAVRNSAPVAIMASYNSVNNVPVTQSKKLLVDVARREWDFKGVFMSDWGAVIDRKESLKNGLDLEMPGNVRHNRESVIESIKTGVLDMGALDRSCLRIMMMADRLKSSEKRNYSYNRASHQNLASEIAEEGSVLLKNLDDFLPLSRSTNICFIGELGAKMHFEGAGSSHVNPNHISEPLDSIKEYGRFPFAKGYSLYDKDISPALEQEALEIAGKAEKIVFFAGLDDMDETEGLDRTDMSLPPNQLHLLDRLLDVNPDIAVVLFAGRPLELPFLSRIPALLTMYLPGQEGGKALARLLFGDANPSGCLSESWPAKESESPSSLYFRGYENLIEYRESIYVGYRYYDKIGRPPLFPFGFGLSYSSFMFDNLRISQEGEKTAVSVDIFNEGPRAGAKVVQLYVGHQDTAVFRAPKELKGFRKVFLEPEEKKTVSFVLSESDFAYYNSRLGRFVTEGGIYQLLIGGSSADIYMQGQVTVKGEDNIPISYNPPDLPSYFSLSGNVIPLKEFLILYGGNLPSIKPKTPLTMTSLLDDFRLTFFGRLIYAMFRSILAKPYKKASRLKDNDPRKENALLCARFGLDMLPHETLNGIMASSNGRLPYKKARGLLRIANGYLISGLFLLAFGKR